MFTRLYTQRPIATEPSAAGTWAVLLTDEQARDYALQWTGVALLACPPGAPLSQDPDYKTQLHWLPGLTGPSDARPLVTPDGIYLLRAGRWTLSSAEVKSFDDALESLWVTCHQTHYAYTREEQKSIQDLIASLPRRDLVAVTLDNARHLLATVYAGVPRWSALEPVYLYWNKLGQWVVSRDGCVIDRISLLTHPDVQGALLLVEPGPDGSLWVLDLLMFDGLIIDHPPSVWGQPSRRLSTITDRLLQAERVQAAYELIRQSEQPKLWLHRTRKFFTFAELGPVLDGMMRLDGVVEAWFVPVSGPAPVYRLALTEGFVEALRGTGYRLLQRSLERIDQALFSTLGGGSRITVYCSKDDEARYRQLASSLFDQVHIVTAEGQAGPPAPVVGLFASWMWKSRDVWASLWTTPPRIIIFRLWDRVAAECTLRPLTGLHRDLVVFGESIAASSRADKPLPGSMVAWDTTEGGPALRLDVPGLAQGRYPLASVEDLEALGRVRRAEHHLASTDEFCSDKERWLSKLQRFGRIDMDAKDEAKGEVKRPPLKRGSPPEVTKLGPFDRADSKLLTGPYDHRPYRAAYQYAQKNGGQDRYISIPYHPIVLPILPTLLRNEVAEVGAQWYSPVFRLATVADGTCLIHSALQAAVPEYQEMPLGERAATGKRFRRGLALMLAEKMDGGTFYTVADGGANLSLFQSAGTDTKSTLYQDLKMYSQEGLEKLYRSDAYLGNETFLYLSYVLGVVIHLFVGYGHFGLREHIVYRTPAETPRKHIAIVGLGGHFETLAVLRSGYLVTVFDEDDEFITQIPTVGKI